MELSVDSMKRTVAIECPRCPFALKEGNALAWKQDAGNSFVGYHRLTRLTGTDILLQLLDFEVGDHEDTLDINGVQLYPPTPGYRTEPFVVTQIDPASGETLPLRVTGYTYHYHSAETVTEAGIELFPVTFRITSIEGNLVNPPALNINLIKDPNGRLMIASFSTATIMDPKPTEDTVCQEWPLLCKWKGILADKVNGLKSSVSKGCHKLKSNPMAEDTIEGKPPHRFRPGRPHHSSHHKEGHHHHSHHGMHMFVRRAFLTVLIPILIGIFAGTLTYLVGMALGCVIAIVVAKVRGRNLYEPVALTEDIDDVERVIVLDEKEVYAELPTYDAPPAYGEDSAEKEVMEQAK
jgi:hypothetical protein